MQPPSGELQPQKRQSAPASPTNYRGRFIYLEALAAEWPELLQALFTQCLPLFQAAVPSLSQPNPLRFKDLRPAPEGESCLYQVQAWADSNNVRDEWVLDAAVQTLGSVKQQNGPVRWFYIAPDLPLWVYETTFQASWIPEVMDWKQFKKALLQQLSESLETYRRKVSPTWGENRRSLAMQAVWTVWWQRGNSPAQILNKTMARKWPKVSPVNIEKGVRSFAGSIGLTLRKSRSRRTA